LELDTELAWIMPRTAAKELFDFAKYIGKKILITSDFYANTEWIKTLLTAKGFDLTGVRLFVSSDTGCTKKEGRLYPYIVEQMQCAHEDILHIGDNFVVDVKTCLSCGIDALHFEAPRGVLHFAKPLYAFLGAEEMLSNTQHRNIEKNKLLAITINRLYNNPFHIHRTQLFENPSMFGYLVLGPLLLGFTQWLHQQVEQDKTECLCFLSRDGWVLHKAFTLYQATFSKTTLPTVYLYCSRRMMNIINLASDFDTVREIMSSRFEKGSVGRFFALRFHLSSKEIQEHHLQRAGFTSIEETISLPRDTIRVMKLVQALRDPILLEAKAMAKRYQRYLASTPLRTDKRKQIGIVDVGYFGSMQMGLQRLLSTFKGHIQGYYLATREEADYLPTTKTKGYLLDKFHPNTAKNPLAKHLILLELFFSAPHPSVWDIREDACTPVFGNADIEKEQWSILEQLHQGALRLIEDVAASKQKVDLTRLHTSQALENLLLSKHPEFLALIKSFVIENAYNGNDLFYPIQSFPPEPKRPPAPAKPQAAPPLPPKAAPKPQAPRPDAAHWIEMGKSAFYRDQLEEALSFFSKAEQENPANVNLKRWKAEVLCKMGQKKEALSVLEEARKALPDNKNLQRRYRELKYPFLAFLYGDKAFSG
jgi:tetratricopeptide (TPR) repeat protein